MDFLGVTFSMAAGAWEEKEITLQAEENVKLTNCARVALGVISAWEGAKEGAMGHPYSNMVCQGVI